MAEAKIVTQFLDRDTRPDFAGPVVGPAIQSWFKNRKGCSEDPRYFAVTVGCTDLLKLNLCFMFKSTK